MSKIIIEIENDQDAQRAQKMLAAYLGNTNEQPDTVAEEPKKEVAKKTTTKKPTTKKVEEKAEEPEPEPEPDGAADGVDLKTLTAIAKDAVDKTDRATVKDTIGEYGEKLSAVDEADYNALAEKLKAL